MDCIADNDIFKPITVQFKDYENNENYFECLRIDLPSKHKIPDGNRELWLRDYDDKNIHSLRVEFRMLSMDLEQGFDNVFLNWQYNDVYSHHYVSWTGKDTAFQSKPGIDSSTTLFWNVLSGDHLQICLNLQSDANITANGFKGAFYIRQELGKWSEWSNCTTTAPEKYRFGGQCGIGVRHKTKKCPSYKWPKEPINGTYDDGQNICVYEERSLNEFCTKAKCENFNNSDPLQLPIKERPNKLKKEDFDWKFNGVHRVDPVYPDPFRYVLASNDVIDIDSMIKSVN